MKPLRIWLVGTGTVATWLAGALGSQRDGPQLAGQGVLSDIIAVASQRAARS